MSSNYERLYRAVVIMSGAGTVQERLASAFRNEIQYVDASMLSEIAQVELAGIRDQLTKEDASGEKDMFDMSAATLSVDQAEELAIEVVNVYDDAARSRLH